MWGLGVWVSWLLHCRTKCSIYILKFIEEQFSIESTPTTDIWTCNVELWSLYSTYLRFLHSPFIVSMYMLPIWHNISNNSKTRLKSTLENESYWNQYSEEHILKNNVITYDNSSKSCVYSILHHFPIYPQKGVQMICLCIVAAAKFFITQITEDDSIINCRLRCVG